MTVNPDLAALGNEVLIKALESTTSPFIITDNQQNDNPIVYTNQAFLDLCGYDRQEVIGHNCRFLQGPGSKKSVVSELRKAVRSGSSTRVTLKNYRKDGQSFWNDLVISPIKNDQGKTTHFIGIQLDITDRVNYTEKLEQIQKKLTRANQELEQFTYAASHDLQEPLRMVSSYLQLLEKRYRSKFDEDGKVFIDFAVEGAERMQALINDLLTLSRVSSTGKRFKMVSFDEIMERALFNLKLLFEETNATVNLKGLPEVTVDSVQIVQLMQNLISNAIKYRKAGIDPIITISAKKEGNSYIFSIADNGIGIEKQYHERIFSIFQRLHTREEYAGTGVGLAICSKIVERHGGKLWVESDGKVGSTFMFSLPIKWKASL